MKTLNKVYLFGNEKIIFDSIPFKILPALRRSFPNIEFITGTIDDLDEEVNIVIIDTVLGINKVSVFRGIEEFESKRYLSVHEFDLISQLKLLKMLGKLENFIIIGIPSKIDSKKAVLEVSRVLSYLVLTK